MLATETENTNQKFNPASLDPKIRLATFAPATFAQISRDLLWNFPLGSIVAGSFYTWAKCHTARYSFLSSSNANTERY